MIFLLKINWHVVKSPSAAEALCLGSIWSPAPLFSYLPVMEILARACWEVAWPLSEGWDFRQSWQRRDKIWCVLPQAEAKDGTEDGIPAAVHPEAIGQLDSQPPYITVLLFAHLIKKTNPNHTSHNTIPLSIKGNNGLQVVPAKHTCFEEYLECHLLLVCLTNSSSNWQSLKKNQAYFKHKKHQESAAFKLFKCRHISESHKY